MSCVPVTRRAIALCAILGSSTSFALVSLCSPLARAQDIAKRTPTQRVTRLLGRDGDGFAHEVDLVTSQWGVSGMPGAAVRVGGVSESVAGSLQVLQRDSDGRWQLGPLLDAGDDAEFDARLGISVDGHRVLSGGIDLIVGGAHGENEGTGAAYVYRRAGASSWSAPQRLAPSQLEEADEFGYRVQIGDRDLAVSAPGDDSGNSAGQAGAVYMFRGNTNATSWTQAQVLRPPSPQLGEGFGLALAMRSDLLAVGAGGRDTSVGADAGAVFVYRRSSAQTWSLEATLEPSDARSLLRFGQSVAISGDQIFVGAPLALGGAGGDLVNAGAVYVFARQGSQWRQVDKLLPQSERANNLFGYTMQHQGSRLIVGGFRNIGGDILSGDAWVFERSSGGAWLERHTLLPDRSNTALNDVGFGTSVSVLGATAWVGALYGTNLQDQEVGALSVFDLSDEASVVNRAPALGGASLVLLGLGLGWTWRRRQSELA